MALRAQFGHGREGEHGLEFSPMRPMAAQALNGQVFVPLVYGLFSDRMDRMLLPIVTKVADLDG